VNPLLAQLVALIFDIVKRHSPTPVTREEIEAEVASELQRGDASALAWFIEKGRLPPS